MTALFLFSSSSITDSLRARAFSHLHILNVGNQKIVSELSLPHLLNVNLDLMGCFCHTNHCTFVILHAAVGFLRACLVLSCFLLCSCNKSSLREMFKGDVTLAHTQFQAHRCRVEGADPFAFIHPFLPSNLRWDGSAAVSLQP